MGTIVLGGGLNLEKARTYGGPIADRQRVRPGDVVLAVVGISQKGSVVGSPGLIPSDAQGDYAVTHHVARLELLSANTIDAAYLYYLLRSSPFQDYVKSIQGGSTVPEIKAVDVHAFRVRLPLYPLQKAIGHFLSEFDDEIRSGGPYRSAVGLRRSLTVLTDKLTLGRWSLQEARSWLSSNGALVRRFDDRIELNRRMNQTLEQIAQALFKSWFVDFGPVRAKAEGRWKKGESLPGMTDDMWELWPSEFEESEIGEIPKGWKPASLTDIASLLTGGTPSTAEPAYWDGGVPWVSGTDVSAAKGGFIIQTERTITQEGIENSAAVLLPGRTVVITARGTVGALGVLASEMCISQTNYGLKASDGIGDNLLWFTVRNVIDQLQQSSYGTIFDTITTRNLQGTTVVLPPEPLRSEFEKRTHPLMERVLLNMRQERTLASTRDALLPKLLSGEIRVPVEGES